MKKILLLGLSIFIVSFGFPQMNINHELRDVINQTNQFNPNNKIGVLITVNDESKSDLSEIRESIQYSIGKHYSAYLTPQQILQLAEKNKNINISGGYKASILLDSARINNKVDLVHNGVEGLDRAYKGKNVIVGVIDTGIDYRHPDFLDENGSNRVKAIWDLSLDATDFPGYSPPNGFSVGIECDAETIASGNCPSVDSTYVVPHGTGVSSVAAGYDAANNGFYSGMAPEAELVVVGVSFSGSVVNQILDGAKFIYDYAQARGLPCVINLSIGFWGSSNDGVDPYTEALEELISAENGRSFVTANGNSGKSKLHLSFTPNNTKQFNYLPWRGRLRGSGFVLYADEGNYENLVFQFQADNKNKDLETEAISKEYTIADFDFENNNGVFEDTIVGLNGRDFATLRVEAEKYKHYLGLRATITGAYPRNHWRLIISGTGKFDVYSGPELGLSRLLSLNNLPTNFPDQDLYREPDLTQNISGLFNASDHVISAGIYHNNTVEYTNFDGEIFNYNKNYPNDLILEGDVALGSSRGPTRDGRVKPDISAPSNLVLAATGLNRLERYKNFDSSNLARKKITSDGLHYTFGGSSASAPSVAGVVALLFEKYPKLSWQEVKEIITSTASKDEFTGDQLPDNLFGYGKLNAFDAIVNAPQILPTETIEFTVEENQYNAELNWKTSVEINNQHFAIYRSTNGEEFEKIATVNAIGDTRITQSYSYIDENIGLSAHQVYYFIKVIDIDESEVSTQVEVLSFGADELTVFSNPVMQGDELVVVYNNMQLVELYNSVGQLVKQIQPESETSCTIRTAGLAKGTYFLVVNGSESTKVVVQ